MIVRDNVIVANGVDSQAPVCGVFFAVAEDVRVEHNVIERNGVQPGRETTLEPGRRGGIIVGVALGGVSTYDDGDDKNRRAVDRPALFVSNNVVDACRTLGRSNALRSGR